MDRRWAVCHEIGWVVGLRETDAPLPDRHQHGRAVVVLEQNHVARGWQIQNLASWQLEGEGQERRRSITKPPGGITECHLLLPVRNFGWPT